MSSCQICMLPHKFYDKVEEGSILIKRLQSFRFCKEGPIVGREDKPISSDLVILATGYKGDQKLKNMFRSSVFQNYLVSSTTSTIPLYRARIQAGARQSLRRASPRPTPGEARLASGWGGREGDHGPTPMASLAPAGLGGRGSRPPGEGSLPASGKARPTPRLESCSEAALAASERAASTPMPGAGQLVKVARVLAGDLAARTAPKGKILCTDFRQVIHPRIPQLAVIGHAEGLANLPAFEIRCQWLVHLLDGNIKLLSIGAMEKDTARWEIHMKR
ncbi:hypothetical protein NL676_036234 [Syzygium grande]|nr:hypothetical protein NL676_036234 [Syzygium grande]